MDEYTYSSIIIDPTEEGIESLIGKEVYFQDNPCLCLKNANDKSPVTSGILVEICRVSINPFLIKRDDGIVQAYPCIIEKKEEPKSEFVPFKSADEFIDEYDNANYSINSGTLENKLLNYGGMWLKGMVSGSYYMVAGICNNGVTLANDPYITSWGELLEDYVFLDDSYCGRLVEEKHE